MQTKPFGFAILLGFGLASPLSSQTFVHVDRGWYDQFGFHNTLNQNYISGVCCGPQEHRNWFVFDLSTVTDVIVSASLVLENPITGGFTSPDASETYTVFEVSTPIASLLGGTGGVAAYNDLAGGTALGSYVATALDNGTLIQIPLNAAGVAALNAAAGGQLALGGALTTIGVSGLGEYLFGGSDEFSVTQLMVETEPAECFMVFGDGTGSEEFYPGMHSWNTHVGNVEGFSLVTMEDVPTFTIPDMETHLTGAGLALGGGGSTSTSASSAGPSDDAATAGFGPSWLVDRTFTVQVVMWAPQALPAQPEQVSQGLMVRVLPDGKVVTRPYGQGTGITLWSEHETKPNGDTVIRFPFFIPGL